ncbi:MAG: ABC transporter ATP-binding protein [Pirellulaceae bacterium]
MPHAIELKGVTKKFGKNTAVKNVDLAVPAGSIYGFIGPNGSGKTTTLRMILRIFQPDSGVVNVLGKDQGKTADDRLGYLPEERGLYKRMKVRELLTYYARLKGFYQCKPEIERWLEKLGAADWADRKIDALSKGMAQKVQFISAVVAQPELVILDEPFSGLDPINMESLRDAILDLRREGKTIVFSTHDMDMAEKLCDNVFMIFEGDKVLDGSMESIQADYPANRLRVQLTGRDTSMPWLGDGVDEVLDRGRYFDVLLNDTSQKNRILQTLAAEREVTRFEVIKPSLHDIFVGIAKPDSLAVDAA